MRDKELATKSTFTQFEDGVIDIFHGYYQMKRMIILVRSKDPKFALFNRKFPGISKGLRLFSYYYWIIALFKLLDEDTRSESITTKYKDKSDYDVFEEFKIKYKDLIGKDGVLRKIRNKKVAHFDKECDEIEDISNDDFETIEKMINELGDILIKLENAEACVFSQIAHQIEQETEELMYCVTELYQFRENEEAI